LQLIFVASQHTSAIGRTGEAMSGLPMEIIKMRMWKKIWAAYIASAAVTGPFVIGHF
jgi:hypothetical protein